MSRIITQESINCFLSPSKNTFSKGNTKVIRMEDGSKLLSLHNNVIAKINNGIIEISNCGWKTNVTKERLNGIPGVHVVQKKGVWYLNGNKWDGGFITL